MVKNIIMFFVGIAVLAFLLGLGHLINSDTEKAAIFIAGSSLAIGGLYLISKWHRKRIKHKKNVINPARIESLFMQLESTGRPVSINGSSALLLESSTVILAAILIIFPWLQVKSLFLGILSTIIGAVIAIFSIILIIDSLYTLGKPSIEISRKGITTPWSGLIAWENIYGIHLKEVRHRGSLINHVLSFRFKDFKPPQTTSSVVKFLRRVKGVSKEKLSLRLSGIKENPEVIYGLTEKLWRSSTGRNYEWSPDTPNDVHDTIIKLKQRKMPTYEDSPQEVHTWLKEQERDFNKVCESLRRARMSSIIMTWFIITAMVIFVVVLLGYPLWEAYSSQ